MKTQNKEMLANLKKLRNDLEIALNMDDALAGIVSFFKAISKWDDLFWGPDFSSPSHTFRILILSNGRNHSGHNHTKKGEVVTPENVFLGGAYDLHLKPISYWQKQKNANRDVRISSSVSVNGYDIVHLQAQTYLEKEAPKLINELSLIESRANSKEERELSIKKQKDSLRLSLFFLVCGISGLFAPAKMFPVWAITPIVYLSAIFIGGALGLGLIYLSDTQTQRRKDKYCS